MSARDITDRLMADWKRVAFWFGILAAIFLAGYRVAPFWPVGVALAQEGPDGRLRVEALVELVEVDGEGRTPLQRIEQALERVMQRQDDTRADIEALRRPSPVVEFSSLSRVTKGVCEIGQPCEVQLRARRTPEGLDCRIVPGRTSHRFVSLVDMEARIARSIPTGVVNIGLDWTWLTVVVITPSMPTGNAEYFVTSLYSECPEAPAGELLEATSRPIPVVISGGQQ